ncbi:DUF2249 domain-containing protein [Alicyclobacillus mengziensis]|uniref:DUF2249 domain-containing protein n=1 Tax=Alicyclobacillus mengziensis TaxID=2931921 RepID=A0A9X7Z5J9_9BACL|nr:DUF2249 domain-containing protein [Alicyclobacillus mengziensis]QSO46397.1 DUF2249 domain-containing protein [Alicyclobacillus mengziensis]
MYVKHLDVRSILLAKGNPFTRITETVKDLLNDGIFELRTTFRPTPLYRYLKKKGFSHTTISLGKGDYLTQFYRNTDAFQFVIDIRAEGSPVLPLVRLVKLVLEESAQSSVVVLVDSTKEQEVMQRVQSEPELIRMQVESTDIGALAETPVKLMGSDTDTRMVRIQLETSRAG